MSDDELFLPEESTSNQSGDLIGSLFGTSTTPPKRERKTFENIFASSSVNRPNTASSSAPKKRPTVTFQDPVAGDAAVISSAKPEPPKPPNSTNLLDNLFSNSLGGASGSAGGRRRQPVGDSISGQRATGRRATDFLDEDPSPKSESAPNRQSEIEIENLRREISTLKYEKGEDQETIQKLQANISTLKDQHSREIESLNRKHREELETLKKRHVEELNQAEKTEKAQADILASIKEYQNLFVEVTEKIENIQLSTSSIREQVGFIREKHDETESVIDFANNQVNEAQKRLYRELQDWEDRRKQSSLELEVELEKLTKIYSEDIVEGRQWIQLERDKLHAERRAFQEEQSQIIVAFETKKEELDDLKSDFLKKEHDLLVRVVNERAMLQQSQREFELQRNADIIRLRKEAEELETCFAQVQNSLTAIEAIRKDYELKNKHLQINVDMISEYLPSHLQKQIKL